MEANNRELFVLNAIKTSVERKDAYLNLSYERLGDAGVAYLAHSADLSHVTGLDLSWNEVTSAGVKALAQAPTLKNLVTLPLQSHQIPHSLSNGPPLEFRDFGVFEVVRRKQKIGRNPKNASVAIVIPERQAVKFTAGKKMKYLIEGKPLNQNA